MTTASKLSLALLALTLVGTSVAQAQSANINATATVQTPLTLAGHGDLAFGERCSRASSRPSCRRTPTAGRFRLPVRPAPRAST